MLQCCELEHLLFSKKFSQKIDLVYKFSLTEQRDGSTVHLYLKEQR